MCEIMLSHVQISYFFLFFVYLIENNALSLGMYEKVEFAMSIVLKEKQKKRENNIHSQHNNITIIYICSKDL